MNRYCLSSKKWSAIWVVVFGLVVAVFPYPVRAESWSAFEGGSFSSGTGYTFHLTPDAKWPDRFGYCLGELKKTKGDVTTTLWSRYLVNNRGPVDVIVSPTGNYVVTMDEWYRMGELPLVFYGRRGELLKAYSLDGLDTGKQRMRTIPNRHWRDNTIKFFSSDERYFVIWFPYGKILIFDCELDAWLVKKRYYEEQKWSELQTLIKKRIEEIALEMLNSKSPRDRQTGAIAAGKLGCKKAIPRLKELLKDKINSLHISFFKLTAVYYVRDAAQKALDLIQKKEAGGQEKQSK